MNRIEEDITNKLNASTESFLKTVVRAPIIKTNVAVQKTPAKTKGITKVPPKVQAPRIFRTSDSFITEWIKTINRKNAGAAITGFLKNKTTVDKKTILKNYWPAYKILSEAEKQTFFK